MSRAIRHSGSWPLAAALPLCLAQQALADHPATGSSMLLDSAQAVEDLVGKHEVASLAKAGAVALLAALVGGAGYMETRTRGSKASPLPAAAVGAAPVREEMASCAIVCDDTEVGLEAMASDFGEDVQDDDDGYEGFMDGMYEGAFDGLGADALVSAGPHIVPTDASTPFSAILDRKEERAVSSVCLVPGASENSFAEDDRGSKADLESEHPADAEQQQEEQLESELAQEYSEAMGDDYYEVMEHEYCRLRSKMVEKGPLLDITT